MFGYVRPPLDALPQAERDRFQALYCGLCHTLRRRCGLPASLILNYDFAFLAMLLSDGEERDGQTLRCAVHPCRGRCCRTGDRALDFSADASVILAYWQLRDGVADRGFWRGLPYRMASLALGPAYRRCARRQAAFDGVTRRQLEALRQLEAADCPSLDQPADTFACLLSAAAEGETDSERRRVLHQILYHLGRWIYLVDAADDLDRDRRSGSYNPLIPRYGLREGHLEGEARRAFAATLDDSIHLIATAYELADFGCWSALLGHTFYQGLYQVGAAVLNGTFHSRSAKRHKERL